MISPDINIQNKVSRNLETKAHNLKHLLTETYRITEIVNKGKY